MPWSPVFPSGARSRHSSRRDIVGVNVWPLAQIQLVDVGFIEVRIEVLVRAFLQELHLDAFVGDAGDNYGTHLSELGVLQNGIEKDFVGINIFSCEVSEHGDVLRTLGKRQFNLQRVIVRVSKDAVLGNVFD